MQKRERKAHIIKVKNLRALCTADSAQHAARSAHPRTAAHAPRTAHRTPRRQHNAQSAHKKLWFLQYIFLMIFMKNMIILFSRSTLRAVPYLYYALALHSGAWYLCGVSRHLALRACIRTCKKPQFLYTAGGIKDTAKPRFSWFFMLLRVRAAHATTARTNKT